MFWNLSLSSLFLLTMRYERGFWIFFFRVFYVFFVGKERKRKINLHDFSCAQKLVTRNLNLSCLISECLWNQYLKYSFFMESVLNCVKVIGKWKVILGLSFGRWSKPRTIVDWWIQYSWTRLKTRQSFNLWILIFVTKIFVQKANKKLFLSWSAHTRDFAFFFNVVIE